jgi:hypothetical protein
MRNRWWWLAVAAVLLLALAVRLHNLTRLSLTNDEVVEVIWSSMNFGDMIDRVAVDMVHPPLDYIVQHEIGLTGAPEWNRRIAPVLFGVATVALTILLATLWSGRAAGLIAGLFLAVSPLHVRFSQEIRPYAMAMFFTTGAIVALELYARRRRVLWAVLWFAGVFLAGFTFYFAGMTAGVVSIARIYAGRRDELADVWRRLPIIVVGWAALYSVWVPTAIKAVRNPPPFAPDTLDWPWWRYRLNAFGAGDITGSGLNFGSIAFWCVVVIGAVLARRDRFLRLALIWLVVCGAIEIIALHYRPHYSAVRHLMPAWIGAIVLAGGGVAFLLRRKTTIPVAAVIAVVFAMYSAIAVAHYYRAGRPDWRRVAEFVHARVHSGDTLIVTNPWVSRNFGYYWAAMPAIPQTRAIEFSVSPGTTEGPAWIVAAQCNARSPLLRARLIQRFPETDLAEVRYVPAGQSFDNMEELCPE